MNPVGDSKSPEIGRDLVRLFENHRTIRRFRSDPVPAEHLEAMKICASRAPSGGSVQLSTLIRVTDSELRQRLCNAAGGQVQVKQAPEFFVACLDGHRNRQILESRQKKVAQCPQFYLLYGLFDVTHMVANLTSAAEALGYGTCYIGALQSRLPQVVKALELPPLVLPVVGVCIGVPAEEIPTARPRLPLNITCMENGYQSLDQEAIEGCLAAMGVDGAADGKWLASLEKYWTAGAVGPQRDQILTETMKSQGFYETSD